VTLISNEESRFVYVLRDPPVLQEFASRRNARIRQRH
jgi:hypothetical protein